MQCVAVACVFNSRPAALAQAEQPSIPSHAPQLTQEDDWIATGLYRAHLVEPHEGRVLIVRFVEPFNSEHAQDRTTAAHGQSKVINARHTVGHEEGRARWVLWCCAHSTQRVAVLCVCALSHSLCAGT